MAIMEIANTNVLIVGGGSGMGQALAKRCLDAGAKVIIAGRNEDKLKRACEELQTPAALDSITVDISQENQVANLFERIGRLDHVVSTAADIDGAYELLPALNLKAAQRVVESKFYGPLLLAKYATPMLSAGGSIAFTSGIAAYRPAARGSVVAAVNAALEGLVRALAIELAPIRVNCRRQEKRHAEGDGGAAARWARWATRRHRRRDRLSDGQHVHDRDDTARRGRPSADLSGAKVSLTAFRNNFNAGA